ncbi:protein FAM200B-like, partial [Aphis craccivora]
MPKRKCIFNDRQKKLYKCFVDDRDVSEANCIICDCYVSVANKGSYDLKAHLDTTKHKSRIASSAVSSSVILDNFVINKNTHDILKVSAVEGTLAFHTVVHHHSYRSMDCTPVILRSITTFSEIVIECLKSIPFTSIATDASNHGNTKMFPILIQYYDYLNGGINVKLIDIKNTKNETSDTVCELLLESRNKNNIKSKCIAFVGDNTNTNFGGINRISGQNIFTKLKSSVNKNLLGVGCPAHILHNAIHHGVDQFD